VQNALAETPARATLAVLALTWQLFAAWILHYFNKKLYMKYSKILNNIQMLFNITEN
jgi:hypothetical protein